MNTGKLNSTVGNRNKHVGLSKVPQWAAHGKLQIRAPPADKYLINGTMNRQELTDIQQGVHPST